MMRILIGVLSLNIAVLVFCLARYGFNVCSWCHKHYWVRSSTSKFRDVFCSYRCNYWDMRDYLAAKLNVDIAEVERYLDKHGWIHPEQVKEGQ